MITLFSRGVAKSYQLPIEFFEGSHGSTLGRCDRSVLDWLPGPWDKEPDVIVWQHKGLHQIALRDSYGRWIGCIAAAKPVREPVVVLELAELMGVESRCLSLNVMNFASFGLGEYIDQHGLDRQQAALLIKPDWAGTTQAPCALEWRKGNRYIVADEAVRLVARLAKALLIDPMLASGTDLAWAFDKALQARLNKQPDDPPIRRIDVEEIIAHERSNQLPSNWAATPRPNAFAITVAKLWSGVFVVHSYVHGENVLIETNDPETIIAVMPHLDSLGIAERVHSWLIMKRVVPAPLEQIDDEMARELAALEVVLK